MEQQIVVFVVSDSIGETAELVVRAVAAQFNGGHVKIKRFSYVDSNADIDDVFLEARKSDAIIAYTIVIPELKKYIDQRSTEEGVDTVDLLNPLIDAFEKKFKKKPRYEAGIMRKLDDDYFRKIEAIEFAVKYDDGRDPRGILKADILLIGVSRTSKTPLSMYLAHQRYKVANVPLVPEIPPPDELFTIPRSKCVGLIITIEKLNEIRTERLKALGLTSNSNYAKLDRILEEMLYAEKIMKRIGCPIINVSNRAVEETASIILETINYEGSKKQ